MCFEKKRKNKYKPDDVQINEKEIRITMIRIKLLYITKENFLNPTKEANKRKFVDKNEPNVNNKT